MRGMTLPLMWVFLLGFSLSYCGDQQKSDVKGVPAPQSDCDPETYSDVGGMPPLEIYRGPKGAVPELVWSLKTPSFGKPMSHVNLEERAPDYVAWFAQFLNADFKDNEPRYRQNLYCNATTSSCNVDRQVVVGGTIERDANGGRSCKPVMLTERVARKNIANWSEFEKMLTAFDVRPKANGTFSLYSAYCYKQNVYAGMKLYCEIDTPVDTPNGILQVNAKVEFKNEKAPNGSEIKFAEQLYNLFLGKSALSRGIQITWENVLDPTNSIEFSCAGPNPTSIPGFIDRRSFNNCEAKLKHVDSRGRATYLVNKVIDQAGFDAEIGEILAQYNAHIGDESMYSIKRAGSFYFSDLKCSKNGSEFKCSYEKL